jgi:hypothetical protein
MTTAEARELALRLAPDASKGTAEGWRQGERVLAGLDGRAWLLLDQAARTFTYDEGTPVSGVIGWLGPDVGEPSGFVAAVTSLHVDGRFRERAVQVLAQLTGPVVTTALSVRLLDHVPQVRDQAFQALRSRLDLETAEVVLDVLLAGRERQHAAAALAAVKASLLRSTDERLLVSTLTVSERRRVRRWAYTVGHERDLLSPDRLLAAVQQDPDQWVRAACAAWLMAVPDPRMLTALLDVNNVEARLVALTRTSDDDLTDDALARLLTDRAPRVREQARWRAHRRELDLASFYRLEIGNADAPRVLAACLDGLANVGNEMDLPTCTEHLSHSSARVRAAAVTAVLARADREEAIRILTPTLLDPSPKVSATAARGLARLNVPPATAEDAWASARPASRRAAWRLTRESGGWHRAEADLRACCDEDEHLSSLGHAGIRNWLDVGAATTWERLPEPQRERLAHLLPASGLDHDRQRIVAFHAGIKMPPTSTPVRADPSPTQPPTPQQRRRWLRLLRGPGGDLNGR